jgi:hypothetical protein
MSEETSLSRRDLLHRIGASMSLGAMGEALLPAQDAQHVHRAVAQAKTAQKGVYRPKALNAHEFATLRRLTALILPADERSPGALEAGAADFIDYLCTLNEELKGIYTGGLAWIDAAMKRRYSADFISARADQQTALLDQIAYRKNDSPELGPGIRFFVWLRNMTVDGYYTSPVGVKELGFTGNGAMAEFRVPEEAVQYALKRSPFA